MQLLRNLSILALAFSPLTQALPGGQPAENEHSIESRGDWFPCGRYTVKIDSAHDEGGFGEMYRGRRKTSKGTDETVAIKKFTRAQDGYGLSRLVPDSSKLMQVLATCTHGGAEYAVAEWVSGDNLRQLAFSETEMLDDRSLKDIFTAALDGLRKLHTTAPRPLAHGDIKPANIIASRSRSRSTLVDYDYLTTDAQKDHFCGSSRYVSPEVMTLKQVGIFETRPNDVWGMAVSIVEVVQGKSPWNNAATPKAANIWRLKTAEQRAQKIKGFFPALSMDLCDILASALCLEDDRMSADTFYRKISHLSRFRTSQRKVRMLAERDEEPVSDDEDGEVCFRGGNSTGNALADVPRVVSLRV